MNQKNFNLAFLVLRLGIGVVFVYHGLLKLLNAAGIAQAVGMSNTLVLILGIVEILAGLLVVLGILVRYAALVLVLVMIGALYFKIFVWRIPFIAANTTGWELDLILLTANLALVLTRGGDWTILRSKPEKKEVKLETGSVTQEVENISEGSSENKPESQVQ